MSQMEIIKNKLKEHLGKKVLLKANIGRKKYEVNYGILTAVYPSLFSINIKSGDKLLTSTYTYSDILTETVKLTLIDEKKIS